MAGTTQCHVHAHVDVDAAHADIGVSLGGSPPGSIQSELDLEVFLNGLGFLHGEQGGGSIHNFAVFENRGYEAMAVAAPCPKTDPVCAGSPSSRPARAIWWYSLLHTPGSTPPHAVNMVLNATEQHRIVDWCVARHVTELYIDQWSSPNPQIQASFEEFVVSPWLKQSRAEQPIQSSNQQSAAHCSMYVQCLNNLRARNHMWLCACVCA